MKYAIRYYSKSGNTEKLAQVASQVLDIPALDITNPLEEDVDILFFGSGVYGCALDPAVISFFDNIGVKVSSLVNFSTAGMMESNYNFMKHILSATDIILSEKEFHCPGSFVGLNKDRPNDTDLEEFRKFVEDFL
ncbi:MAG: flavodoxin [Methanosphaera sp.]|nr:flavodoxin [Methanosphaera sp.]